MPKKEISGRKRKNRTCACAHGRYLLYQTFPHGGRQTQRYFNVFSPSSRRHSKKYGTKSMILNLKNSDNLFNYNRFKIELLMMIDELMIPVSRKTHMGHA